MHVARTVRIVLPTTTGSNCIDPQLYATWPTALKIVPHQSLLGLSPFSHSKLPTPKKRQWD